MVQSHTSGTVWDGELNTVVFGAQYSNSAHWLSQ